MLAVSSISDLSTAAVSPVVCTVTFTDEVKIPMIQLVKLQLQYFACQHPQSCEGYCGSFFISGRKVLEDKTC